MISPLSSPNTSLCSALIQAVCTAATLKKTILVRQGVRLTLADLIRSTMLPSATDEEADKLLRLMKELLRRDSEAKYVTPSEAVIMADLLKHYHLSNTPYEPKIAYRLFSLIASRTAHWIIPSYYVVPITVMIMRLLINAGLPGSNPTLCSVRQAAIAARKGYGWAVSPRLAACLADYIEHDLHSTSPRK